MADQDGDSSPLGKRFLGALAADLEPLIPSPEAARELANSSRAKIPGNIAEKLDAILAGKKTNSYRDALLIQFGCGLQGDTPIDHTMRLPGGRSTAAALAIIFADRHIAAVKDAFQNIGKNTSQLARGNLPAFDETLLWGNTAPKVQRRAVYDYVLANVSLTARKVLQLPEIDRARLTFVVCATLMDELLRIPSGGAYQQFAVAACLHALIEEFGQGGVNGLRVETKNINASDASSKVVGDIQIMRGQRVEEAFEVTANDWRSKVPSAIQSAKQADLPRTHILADVEVAFPANTAELAKAPVDVTVIDVTIYLRTLLATMRKPAREAAFVRLYELLDRHQPQIERVNDYVRLLNKHGLAVANATA